MTDSFIPYGKRAGYLLNGLPDPHKRRLQKRAKRENTSLANIVAGILSERCGVPFMFSSRPLIQSSDSSRLSLRLPTYVLDCIRDEANERHVTMRTVILDALSQALKLKPPPPTSVDPARRPGRPRTGAR